METRPRVLVTGASSGIGAAVARELGARGAAVVLVARSRPGLERTAAAVREAGGEAHVAVADVTDADALSNAVDEGARRFGGLDGAVLAAAASAYGELRSTRLDDVRRTIDVTLGGAIATVAAVLPHLERTGGTIVAVGSLSALQPQPLLAPYAAAKHGLRGLLGSLRLELAIAGSPVRVAMVHPGPVDTPFWTHVVPTGPMPPTPPIAYAPETVAAAVLDALERPRRPERLVGVAMRTVHVARLLVRPASDAVLSLIASRALRHGSSVPSGRALHEPSGTGAVRSDTGAARSPWARARGALRSR